MNCQWGEEATMLQHLGEDDHIIGSVVPPLFQVSTFVFNNLDEFEQMANLPEGKHAYSRITNPTVRILEKKVAALEHAEEARIFSSGMAATSCAILSCAKAGDHVIAIDTVYGPTQKFLAYLEKFGVSHTLVDGRDPQTIFDAVRPETRLVCLESPSSLVFHLQDLQAVAEFCRPRGIHTMIDNTYGLTIQRPLDLGIDIVVHSASKMIGGHSDVVAGALATSKARIDAIMGAELELLGSIISPFPAWLMIRGLRTLLIRIERTRATTNMVADFLADRPEVERLMHLGRADFEQADLVKKQMSTTGALFSFVPNTNDRCKIKAFVEALKVFKLGVSWGGHESLVVATRVKPLAWPEPRYVIRLCIGLEDPQDLIDDLTQALPHLQ